MKKKHSIGMVLLLEVIVFVIMFSVNSLIMAGSVTRILANFIDFPSIVVIVLIVAPALIVSGMGKDFGRAFTVGKKEYSLHQLKRSAEAVQMVQRLVVCGAGITVVMSLVVIMGKLDTIETIGPNLAVAVLAAFYAFIIEFLLVPLKANLQNAITDMMDVSDEAE